MPDYSIATQVKTPGMESLGSIMNMATAAQNLQKGGLEIQRMQGVLQPEIERAKAESSRAVTEADVSRRTADPRVQQQQQNTLKATTEAAQAAQGLTQDQRAIVAGVVGTLGRAGIKDPAVFHRELENLKTVNPDNPGLHKVIDSYRTVLDNLPDKAELPKLAIGASQYLLKPSEAQGMNPQAGTVSLGGSVNPAVTTPSVMGSQPSVAIAPTGTPTTIGPQGAEVAAADALGRPVIEAKSPAGQITYKAPPGTGYKPLMALPPGETKETAAPLLALRENAQKAAASAPAQHFNNQEIMKLSDAAFTGTGSSEFSKVLNAVGIQRTNDIGADTAKLRHFIALQVEQNAAAQGASTDAARSAAEAAVLPGSSPAQAIKAIVKVNDAYTTGAELFNRGMNAAINHPQNEKDIYAVRDFQNAWTRNLDPRIFMLENASAQGDKAEIARIKKELGPEGVTRLLQKAQALRNLATQGRAE